MSELEHNSDRTPLLSDIVGNLGEMALQKRLPGVQTPNASQFVPFVPATIVEKGVVDGSLDN